MDLKKIFNDNKAVSPVIGVVLMVAITVILAAAIGSSVFGQGPSESAPQSNIDIIVVDSDTIKLEHLGGDSIILDPATTSIMFARGDESFELDMSSFGNVTGTGTNATATYATLDVGMTKALDLREDDGNIESLGDLMTPDDVMAPGEFATVKIVDVKTKQLIADKELRF